VIARLAWRGIWRHRRRTLITVASIGFGLACVVFFVAIADGMYAKLVEDAVRMQAGHVTLEHPEYRDAPEVGRRLGGTTALRARIGRLPAVERTKVLVLGQGLARSGAGAVGVGVFGVEPSVEAAESPLARRLVEGAFLDDGDATRVVLGAELARRLDVKEDSKLVLSTNDASGALVEALFRVKGIFRTGAEEIDGYLVVLPISAARRLFGLGADEATQLGVILTRPEAVPEVLAALRRDVGGPGVVVRPWQEVLPELAAFMRLDRTSDYTFQGLLLLLVLFTIFNTILMSVLERQREFAVLLALGTQPEQLRRQLLLEAAYVGLLGCALGLGVGGAVSGLVQVYGWDISFIYEEGFTISGLAVAPRIHAKVTAALLLVLGGVVLGATVLLAVPGVRRVGRLRVAELLR
jgi:ABC-type lipoprotein release transport system permease subunit